MLYDVTVSVLVEANSPKEACKIMDVINKALKVDASQVMQTKELDPRYWDETVKYTIT